MTNLMDNKDFYLTDGFDSFDCDHLFGKLIIEDIGIVSVF
jgi:hypothetical protein